MRRVATILIVILSSTYASEASAQCDVLGVDKDLYKHQRVGKSYTIMGKRYQPKHDPKYDKTGIASWYGDKFHGKPTATGEIYNKNDITAAHKTLPLNSIVCVTNLETGKTIEVRLNDRGPFVGNRLIDLSEATAKALGITTLSKVRVQYAGPADPMASQKRFPAPEPTNPIYKPAAPKSRPPAPIVYPFDETGQETLTIGKDIHLAD